MAPQVTIIMKGFLLTPGKVTGAPKVRAASDLHLLSTLRVPPSDSEGGGLDGGGGGEDAVFSPFPFRPEPGLEGLKGIDIGQSP